MSEQESSAGAPPRLGRSIAALLAGFLVVVVLSIATDIALHAMGIYPALGQRMSDNLFLLATAYRTLYGVLSAYVVAGLAPYKPMQHALIGGLIGLLLAIVGAVTTWNKDLGPHWYALALVVLALPQAWLGAKLWQMRAAS